MDQSITIKNLCKSYDHLPVLQQVNLTLSMGKTYCLMGASGSGKTTLLRILLGLEQADEGTVSMPSFPEGFGSLVAVFQENRLCDSFSALEHVTMVTGHTMTSKEVFAELCRLLPEESVLRPVSTLSGGMRRRVAIARALLAPSSGILMDEPFTGLDEDTKHVVIDYVKEKTAGKLLLVTTHLEEEVQALEGQLLHLNSGS